MKIIIDAYRGGNDTGIEINGKYEKNLLLNLSKYMKEEFEKNGVLAELVRDSDISLTEEERNIIINEMKNDDDIIIDNRLSQDSSFNIIYPLRTSDALVSKITQSLKNDNINVTEYYQRRLPSNPINDYYSIIRNTKPNETIIIEYNDIENYQKTINIIVNTIIKYIDNNNYKTYQIKKGDTLYGIAKQYNISIDEIKQVNDLTTNTLTIGSTLKIPIKIENQQNYETYQIKKGDTLYGIGKKYNISVDKIKQVNNLTTNTLTIGNILKIPTKIENQQNYEIYQIKKGDTLYGIGKKYNVSVDKIKQVNDLTTNTLTIGNALKIPK